MHKIERSKESVGREVNDIELRIERPVVRGRGLYLNQKAYLQVHAILGLINRPILLTALHNIKFLNYPSKRVLGIYLNALLHFMGREMFV